MSSNIQREREAEFCFFVFVWKAVSRASAWDAANLALEGFWAHSRGKTPMIPGIHRGD